MQKFSGVILFLVNFLLAFFEILVFVKGLDFVIFAQSSESIDKMGTEVGVDILRTEFCGALAVHRPVGIVTYDSSIVHLTFYQTVCFF